MNFFHFIRRALSVILMFFGFSLLVWGAITIIRDFLGEALIMVFVGGIMVIAGAFIARGKTLTAISRFIGRKVK